MLFINAIDCHWDGALIQKNILQHIYSNKENINEVYF